VWVCCGPWFTLPARADASLLSVAGVDSLLTIGELEAADSLAVAWAAAASPTAAAAADGLQIAGKLNGKLRFEAAVAVLAAVEPGDASTLPDTLRGEILHALAKALLNLRRPEEALPRLDGALDARRRARGDDHPDVAGTLAFRAIAEHQMGNEVDAEADFRESLRIYEQTLGPDHGYTIWALNAYASFLQSRNRLEEAKAAYAEVLRHREGQADLDTAWTLNNLGGLSFSTTDFAAAERYYARAHAIRERELGPEHPYTAASLIGLANARFFQGDYLPARSLLEEGVRALSDLPGDTWRPELIAALNALALAYYWTGEPERALPVYEDGLALLRAQPRPDPARECHLLAGIAWCDQRLGRQQEAEAVHDEIVTLAEASFGADTPTAALTRIDRAQCLAEGQRLNEAVRDFGEAVDVLRREGSAYAYGWSLADYGDILLRAGHPRAAFAAFSSADSALMGVLWEDHPRMAQIQAGLARCRLAEGDYDGARSYAFAALDRSRHHFLESLPYLSEWHAVRYRASSASLVGLLVALTAKDAGGSTTDDIRAWEALADSRCRILDEVMVRNTLRASSDSVVTGAWTRFDGARRRLANLYCRSGDLAEAGVLEALAAAAEQREEAEREWAAATADSSPESPEPLSFVSVAAGLSPGQALVSYARYVPAAAVDRGSPAYVGWVTVAGADHPVRIELGPAEAIESAATAWHEHMMIALANLRLDPDGTMAAYRSVGDRVRTLIWDPLVPALGQVREILVVPAGSLHLVSLAALPEGADRFLQDTGIEFRYLDAEEDVIRSPGSREGSGLLALGDPEFSPPETAVPAAPALDDQNWILRSLERDCDTPLRADPPRLPGTAREVAAIEELWAPSGEVALVLTGPQATERELVRDAPGKRVIHLATHGFFPEASCSRTATPDPGGADWLSDMNALLRSGLLLAEDPHDPGRDGFLTAEEAAGLDLAGVDLVVLSGCGTGLGTVRDGEGVFGLRRSFRIAGARNLLFSLWPLPDQLTQDWMQMFYTAYLSPQSDLGKAETTASSELLEQLRSEGRTPHPVLWAGPVLSGTTRAR